ncbi:MAG TPA: GNAT family N-acetyltransferase [Flavobacteriales bacterium]|nr:GNAT family N-acetyltransferase [Flavobacteriales bacterium]HPH82964.1 GNAT family N-acetyltransferase [Flavobacteriales bacterium]
MEYTLVDNSAEQQFEFLLEDGEKAFVTYRIKEGVVYLLHTSVPEHFEGKGIASQLAKKVFSHLKESGTLAKLYCAYLRTYVERHPEWEIILVA